MHPEWHFITCWSTNYCAIIVHADFAQYTDFDAIWSARRMGAVLPTPVTDLCAEAVHVAAETLNFCHTLKFCCVRSVCWIFIIRDTFESH